MREEEVDSLVAADLADRKVEEAQELAHIGIQLITVLEKLFDDFQENINSAASNCENHDASTALWNISSAIDMMDIPYLVREALEVPHDAPANG